MARLDVLVDCRSRFSFGVSTTKDQLVEKHELWKDFDDIDWLIILERIKNDPFKLYGFIPFSYTILGIEHVHEFLKLKEVKQKLSKYVDSGKRFPIHSITERDINYYQDNRLVKEETKNSNRKYKDQGATVIEEYQVQSRRTVENIIKRYIRKIKRKEITLITYKELCVEK